jgi:membrane protein
VDDGRLARVRRVGADLGRWYGLSRRIYLIDLCARTMEAFAQRRMSTYAAALSYYVLLSFFPLIIFIVAVVSMVVPEEDVQREVALALLRALPAGVNLEGSAEIVVTQVGQTNRGLIGFVAVLAMAWSASTMFTALRRALTTAFAVPEERNPFRAKAMDLAGVAGVIVFIVVASTMLVLILLLISLGFALGQALLPRQAFEVLPLGLAGRALGFLLSYMVSFCLMVLAYRVVPGWRRSVRELRWGAALAALGFEAVKFGFGLYLARFGRYQEIYGALANGVAFLVFVYVAAIVVLLVAVLMSVRWAEHTPEPAAVTPEPQPG